jgi:hypothetical protein
MCGRFRGRNIAYRCWEKECTWYGTCFENIVFVPIGDVRLQRSHCIGNGSLCVFASPVAWNAWVCSGGVFWNSFRRIRAPFGSTVRKLDIIYCVHCDCSFHIYQHTHVLVYMKDRKGCFVLRTKEALRAVCSKGFLELETGRAKLNESKRECFHSRVPWTATNTIEQPLTKAEFL